MNPAKIPVQLNKVGIIEPMSHNLMCGVCKYPIDQNFTKPETILDKEPTSICPNFCIKCETWFHPKCLPSTSFRNKKFYCPTCGEKAELESPNYYCDKCSKTTSVSRDTTWPNIACSKCGKPVSIAVTTSVISKEIIWLIIPGFFSLALFIGSLLNNAPKAIIIITGSLGVIFALPWILMILSGLIQGMMPMSIDLSSNGVLSGGLDTILIDKARAFKMKPLWYRLVRIYFGWLLVNGLTALFIIVSGLAIIYFITETTRK